VYSGAGAGSGTSFTSSSSKDTEKALKKDLEEERESVEALLEPFFIHSEQSKKRLAIMREAVNDTENMNELNLDQIRNELFKMEVTLTNATLAAGFFAAVVGAFGMNLRNGMENSRPAFLTVVGLTGLVMLAMSFGIQYTIYRQIQ
jgi:Mg2+ and Co2+ transporter CorA